MMFIVLLLGVCQAWQHFLSFNHECSAELSLLRGSQLETTFTAGRIPYQFKHALTEVLKARILAEGCDAQNNYDLFFGMNMRSALRFLDASDTSLASATVPPSCSSLSFNWKLLKESFPGIVLPSSCTAAGFQTSGKCQVKFKFLDNLFIELVIQENCNTEAQTGYGLPSFNLFCSGSLCESFARPCSANSDCSTGVTCDALPGDISLADTLEPLINFGLYNNATDAGCNDATNSFQEKFWSGIINSGAYLAGLSPTVSSKVFKEVKLCGLSDFMTAFIPTSAPTPVQQYECADLTTLIPVSNVCDGKNDCPGSDDEARCCQPIKPGFQNSLGTTDCCPICPNEDPSLPSSCGSANCASSSYSSSGEFNPLARCSTNADDKLQCPDLIIASDTPIPNSPAKQVLSSVSSSTPDQHIAAWADCNGNLQFGSAAELGVLNARLPIHRVIAELEKVIKSLETCRGTAPTSWARHFFPWATSMWGGVFFSNQADQNVYGNVNPGAKLDDSLRYYKAAEGMSPPFANVANPPATCDLTSTTGATPSCELSADISSWFDGPSFPAGWNGPTILKVKFASTCTDTSAPTVFLTCEGKCDATAKSGCCILRNAILPQTTGSCPAGYQLRRVDTEITDFVLNQSSIAKSNDTTLINFLFLVLGRQIKFGGGSPFVGVKDSEAMRSFCFLNGESFGNNTETWSKTAVTEDCPVPADPPNGTKGCPQFIVGATAKLKGCTGSSCLTAPITSQCSPQCPLPPTEGISPAFILAPALGLLGVLALV